MKNIKSLKYFSFLLFTILAFNSCQDLAEPELGDYPLDGPIITFVTPSPSGTTQIQTLEPIAPITIQFSAEDDIAITNITVAVDGTQITEMTSFDNAQMVEVNDLVYDNVTTGNHTVTVTVTDSDGNVATETVNFAKVEVEPYTPVYGETFYMPFDNNFYDLVSLTPASEVGTPSFAGESYTGDNAYVAGTDNYLTFPSTGLTSNEFSGAFWYKVSGTPDRAGIISIGNVNGTEDRTQGLRLFREGSATEQRIKLNVGTGAGESWNDGGVIDVTAGEWVHVAFTISTSETVIYINGEQVNTGSMPGSISWNGCENFTIGAGGPTFSYWGHTSDSSTMDELMFFNRPLTLEEVQGMAGIEPYEPILPSETFYMPFDDDYSEVNSGTTATEVGTPTFAGENYMGSNAYMGATDSYLEFPKDGLFGTEEFSIVFWYKVNATPDRAGILVVGNPNVAEDRTKGFRLFREGDTTNQRIKLNLGTSGGESWNDGGLITVADNEWVQVAVTISSTESKIYLNGELQTTSTFTNPVDWTDTTDLTIGSGEPTFSYWNHLSDISAIDELRIFNTALTQAEIQNML